MPDQLAVTSPEPKCCWYRLTLGWLVLGCQSWNSCSGCQERFHCLAFNEHKGWTVLIAVATVGIALVLMLLRSAVALLFHWWFQFSIRSLLVPRLGKKVALYIAAR